MSTALNADIDPIADPITDLLGATACLRAAMRVRLVSPERVRAFLAELTALAHPQPLELDLAMLLAWLRRQDPADLGFSSLSAFYAERVDWGASWRKALVRLVESDLDLVKRAVCERVLPLRVAVRAPGAVAVDQQEAWIAAGGAFGASGGASAAGGGASGAAGGVALAHVGAGPEDGSRARSLFDWHHGEEAEVIRRARREARACLGRAASAREVDEYLVACHAEKTPPTQILARAHERPAPPEPPGPMSWGWCAADEPGSVAEALERLDRLQDALRGRTAVLARAWVLVTDEALWVETDCASAEEFANEHLGISLRQAQRLARLGWALVWYPELDAAIRDGLSARGATAIASVVGERTMGRWLEIAGRVGRKELLRAVQDARDGSSMRTLASYEGAIEAADAWVAAGAIVGRPNGATSAGPVETDAVTAATSAGPVADAVGGATSAGRIRVALPHDEPGANRSLVGAPSGVLAASRWWCDNVRIPKKYGFAAVKEREHYQCQNPECGRVSLRNEAHHVYFRSEGGDDSPENAVTLCRPCHLRGVHGGRLRVEPVVADGIAALLWTWPDGRRVLAFRERPA